MKVCIAITKAKLGAACIACSPMLQIYGAVHERHLDSDVLLSSSISASRRSFTLCLLVSIRCCLIWPQDWMICRYIGSPFVQMLFPFALSGPHPTACSNKFLWPASAFLQKRSYGASCTEEACWVPWPSRRMATQSMSSSVEPKFWSLGVVWIQTWLFEK